jgi:cytochrome c oxidase subunit 1
LKIFTPVGTEGHRDLHVPSPSFFPIMAALGLPILATGFIYHMALMPLGAIITVVGLVAWALEPPVEHDA